jgi:hypothetical protein
MEELNHSEVACLMELLRFPTIEKMTPRQKDIRNQDIKSMKGKQ